jgi:solute:Na+ symporter, SSS family
MNSIAVLTIVVVIYLFAIAYLGYYGYRKTQTATDYLVAGRKAHPVIMALSYGATFISTSAIVGFGGVAANLGMGVLWLTFLNIFVGIFIAFVVFGKRTRKIGHNLDAHTFPELLAKRFDSKFIQGFSGLVIFLLMPLYAAAVLIGAARFIEQALPNYQYAFQIGLLIYTILISGYVLAGGLKGVMYTDALQGTIMFVGMAILLFATYYSLGGVSEAHRSLAALAGKVPPKLAAGGHQGWTAMPKFNSTIWWSLVSTIVMGVGIGVLAQPQLVVRFMTVKSSKELNRAVGVGGLFILFMTGVAFVVGALSNVYFVNNPKFGTIAFAAAGKNVDKIIPLYITTFLPPWFWYVFMLTLLSAAMSTSSSQFHTMGTAIGRDFFEQTLWKGKKSGYTIALTRLGIVVAVLLTALLGFLLPNNIVALVTSIFFGTCASMFLPTYIGALYWRGMTRAGAISSVLWGFLGSAFWYLFIHVKESDALRFCNLVFHKPSLAANTTWANVDPVVVILPISFVVAVVISLITRKLPRDHVDTCFKHV